MAIKRVMGTETEYGISGGDARDVVAAYKGNKKEHTNLGKTNQSVLSEFKDIGGHIGGDYGSIHEQIEEEGGFLRGNRGIGFESEDFPQLYFSGKGYLGTRSHRGRKSSAGIYAPRIYSSPDATLNNGARLYVDMGHPEYSTPETENPRELVVADKAGELIVSRSAKIASPKIQIYKNNSDGQGNSYGCHENYLIKRFSEDDFRKIVVKGILPFFITRQIFTGSGKIGIEEGSSYHSSYEYAGWNFGQRNIGESDKESKKTETWKSYERQRDKTIEALENLGRHFLDIPEFEDLQRLVTELTNKREHLGEQQIYQLSQRADFFEELIGLQTTHNRPIINTRDEPHADTNKYMRLHVICGDANMSEVATYLKVGTTSLVLDLIEDGLAPEFTIINPVKQIKRISSDLTRKWNVQLSEGKTIPAIEIQRAYLTQALHAYSGRDDITDDVLKRWQFTLDALESDPMKLANSIDWIIKLNLAGYFMEKDNLSMLDTKIMNAALQYHDIDREKGLFYYLQKQGLVDRIITDEEIENAVNNPPENTRAYLRAKAGSIDGVSSVDWGGFRIDTKQGIQTINLEEPFAGTKEQVGSLIENYSNPDHFVEQLGSIEGIKISKGLFSSAYNKIKGKIIPGKAKKEK